MSLSSVVSKETTELGDKEELKIDKITFQTDEADETDPSLAKPGNVIELAFLNQVELPHPS